MLVWTFSLVGGFFIVTGLAAGAVYLLFHSSNDDLRRYKELYDDSYTD